MDNVLTPHLHAQVLSTTHGRFAQNMLNYSVRVSVQEEALLLNVRIPQLHFPPPA